MSDHACMHQCLQPHDQTAEGRMRAVLACSARGTALIGDRAGGSGDRASELEGLRLGPRARQAATEEARRAVMCALLRQGAALELDHCWSRWPGPMRMMLCALSQASHSPIETRHKHHYHDEAGMGQRERGDMPSPCRTLRRRIASSPGRPAAPSEPRSHQYIAQKYCLCYWRARE